jgi:Domain of unknown function (DUF4405)
MQAHDLSSNIEEPYFMPTHNRSNQLWIVNVAAFIIFCILGVTGLINWLLLPRGAGSGGGFVIALRHFLRDLHEWAALGFIIVVAIHLVLHWGYIKSNLKKSGLAKAPHRN